MNVNKLPHQKAPCRDCPYRRDSLAGWLGEARATELVRAKSFVCHKKPHLQCAGHMLLNQHNNDFVALAQRLGYTLNLSGTALVFNTRAEFIAHHSQSKKSFK
jgi:hypothetical protein